MWSAVILIAAIAVVAVVLACSVRRKVSETFTDAVEAAGALRWTMKATADSERLGLRFDVVTDGVTQEELQLTNVRGYFLFSDGERVVLEATPYPQATSATEAVRAKMVLTKPVEVMLDAVDTRGKVRMRIFGTAAQTPAMVNVRPAAVIQAAAS